MQGFNSAACDESPFGRSNIISGVNPVNAGLSTDSRPKDCRADHPSCKSLTDLYECLQNTCICGVLVQRMVSGQTKYTPCRQTLPSPSHNTIIQFLHACRKVAYLLDCSCHVSKPCRTSIAGNPSHSSARCNPSGTSQLIIQLPLAVAQHTCDPSPTMVLPHRTPLSGLSRTKNMHYNRGKIVPGLFPTSSSSRPQL